MTQIRIASPGEAWNTRGFCANVVGVGSFAWVRTHPLALCPSWDLGGIEAGNDVWRVRFE